MDKFKRFYGWGLNQSALSIERKITNLSEGFESQLEAFDRGLIPSGQGRSYGDSALNSGGIRLSSSELKRMSIDHETGIAICGAGVTISELENESLKVGFFPYVVPGTGEVSLGGAFASDVHGKSQHRAGNFSDHVLEIKVLNASGKANHYQNGSEEFCATAGGMGLTGFIQELKIQLRKVENSKVDVVEFRAKNLKELLSLMGKWGNTFEYSVAWLDMSGKNYGRGILSVGNHSEDKILKNSNSSVRTKLQFRAKKSISIFTPIGLVNRISVNLFNTLWYWKPLKNGNLDIQKFMHPLDGISNWNKIYGKKGFIQYQFVIPERSAESLFEILGEFQKANITSSLTVLKQFGKASNSMLGFPMPGFTLAVDIPANTRHISLFLNKMDVTISKLGGRIYLSKDSMLGKNEFIKMYPNLESWKKIKQTMDPENIWNSNQSRRLELC